MDKNLTNISDVNGNHNSRLSPPTLELKEIKRPNLVKPSLPILLRQKIRVT